MKNQCFWYLKKSRNQKSETGEYCHIILSVNGSPLFHSDPILKDQLNLKDWQTKFKAWMKEELCKQVDSLEITEEL